jgi:flavin-dependent dehydrogenase
MLSGKLLADAIAAHSESPDKILRQYKKKSNPLMRKMRLKVPKMRILTSPFLRKIIMKSGISSIKDYTKERSEK